MVVAGCWLVDMEYERIWMGSGAGEDRTVSIVSFIFVKSSKTNVWGVFFEIN
jgi:hypothetical protein